MSRETQPPSDLRDKRSGAYDAINEAGRPQPDQIAEVTTPHQAAQHGADVRGEPVAQGGEMVPERLRRPPKGPLNPKRGRDNSP
jgi:hypothetical protein